ncbi:GNAT family N-acetyltransferase [Stappia sp. F7233]|uniref:GNAT family N-acetyltransferase n=1 Tax=Stappia albiluteola TaxID=2758565 RepID=A0A839ACG8_9HYPH|nr:GNAT family N-acetyltransferase [Stappia albiluteola]MBA5776632.1 GNAT family N-acetyltransferase [Stappia albiluteola]
MRYFLGDEERRRRLFLPGLDRSRIVAVVSGTNILGYASFKLGNRGPLNPVFADFRREYGAVPGLVRMMIFHAVEWRERAAGQFYVYGIFVKPKHRRKGVGKMLLAALVERARREGAPVIELEVAENNERAISLYEGYGFTVTRRVGIGFLRRFFPFSALLRMQRPSGDAG